MTAETLKEISAKALAERIKRALENHIIDPAFQNYLSPKIGSLPELAVAVAEWSAYILSGTVHTLGPRDNPLKIMLTEVAADVFSSLGKRIADGPCCRVEDVPVISVSTSTELFNLTKDDAELCRKIGFVNRLAETNTCLKDHPRNAFTRRGRR